MTLIRFLINAKRLRATALFFVCIIISNFRTGYCAQAGGAGFLFLEEPLNPRSIGMGSAGTAAADGGFAYYNPGLIAYAPRGLTRLEYGQMPGDLSQGHLETAWHVTDNFYGGADWHLWSIGNIGITNEQTQAPYLYGASQDTRVGLLAAYTLHGVALGLALNGLQSRIVASTAYGISFSAGAATAFFNNRLRAGLAAFNEGYATSYLTFPRDWERYRLPRSARAGLSFSDTLRTVSFTIAADGVYRDEDERFMLPVGLEVKPVPALALRIGECFNNDADKLSCGVGLYLPPLTLNCGFTIAQLVADGEIETRWIIGLEYSLSRQ